MQHDYGLKEMRPLYGGRDFNWEEKTSPQKMILVNVNDCINKITVSGMTETLRGLGKIEWEIRLAGWLVEDIVQAIEDGKKEADITTMFSYDMIGYDSVGEYRIRREMLHKELVERLFEVVETSETECKLQLTQIQ